jgi:hypothetical protein
MKTRSALYQKQQSLNQKAAEPFGQIEPALEVFALFPGYYLVGGVTAGLVGGI